MKVVWSDRSLRSLAEIHSHISVDSEDAAHRTIDAILKRGDLLAEFPQMGRSVDRYDQQDIRELVERPYRIVYRARPETVEIIDVFHSAQLPPWER